MSYDVEAGYALSDWSGGEDRPPWSEELRLACDEIVSLRAEYDAAIAVAEELPSHAMLVRANERVEATERERDEAGDAAAKHQLLHGNELTRRQAAEQRVAELAALLQQMLDHMEFAYYPSPGVDQHLVDDARSVLAAEQHLADPFVLMDDVRSALAPLDEELR